MSHSPNKYSARLSTDTAADRPHRGRVQAATSAGGTPGLAAFWSLPEDDVLQILGVDRSGLSSVAARQRLARSGPNRLAAPHRAGWLLALARQFTDPIVLILIFASVVSVVLGDVLDASIILVIVVLSGALGFWQEHRAALAVQRLLALVRMDADLRRDGRETKVPLDEVVPGDIVVLNAGDVVPCDCRLLDAHALQVDEAALTGETFPRHKHADPSAPDAPLAERHSGLFLGSHIVSGRGEAVAVATGARTELGQLSRRLEESVSATEFERGIRRLGLLLARVTFVMAMVILAVNLVLHRPFTDSLLFSLALAVGLTPQLLPAIVAVSLSSGAQRMARERVIVRRLDAIEDFGAMDVLCTDKTGTLTEGAVRFHSALDPSGSESEEALALAALNAGLQSGFSNPIDVAIVSVRQPQPGYRAVDEEPFDFTRKRLSVLVEGPSGRQLICKGAYESVLEVCDTVRATSRVLPIADFRGGLDTLFRRLSQDGYRVLAIAQRDFGDGAAISTTDERQLMLVGFLTFEDPAKTGAAQTLAELAAGGVSVRMITGDNRLAAAHVAAAVGMDPRGLLTGRDLAGLDDHQLLPAVRDVHVFAEVDPLQKERIISALREGGATVGYLGDGINDAGALHLADVGISVDTAVDVAKNAAAIVLLDKDLSVLCRGILLGRQTFANTLKYVYTTVSANFGNVTSMVIASAFLPFLPLLPRQILLLNFVSDIPSTTIAVDRVDPEQLGRPQRWDIRAIRDFMIVFGLLSTAFDLLTFTVLLQVFHARATLFQSGWFLASALTELAVLLVLRTRRPAIRSRPATSLLVSSLVVTGVTLSLPFLPYISTALGLQALPAKVLWSLALIVLAYVTSAEAVKRRFYRAVDHAAHSPQALTLHQRRADRPAHAMRDDDGR